MFQCQNFQHFLRGVPEKPQKIDGGIPRRCMFFHRACTCCAPPPKPLRSPLRSPMAEPMALAVELEPIGAFGRPGGVNVLGLIWGWINTHG